MQFAAKLAALGGLASTAAAHGIVNAVVADGEWHTNFQIGHLDMDDPPETAGWTTTGNRDHGFVSVADYQSPDVICHRGAMNAKTSVTVSAGGTLEWQWTEWPVSHPGPVITYFADCKGDCTTVDKEELEFVKVEEMGWNEEKGKFAAVILAEEQNSTWTTNIPDSLAAGNYVFRHEIIGLYGKQHYPQCLNVEITGDGTESPDGVPGVELYDEDFDTNPTGEDSGYRVPGPKLWTPGTIPAQNAAPSGSAAGTGSAPTSTAMSSSAAPSSTAADNARDPGAETTFASDAPCPSGADNARLPVGEVAASAAPTGASSGLPVAPSAAPSGYPAPTGGSSGFPAILSGAPSAPSGFPAPTQGFPIPPSAGGKGPIPEEFFGASGQGPNAPKVRRHARDISM